MTFGGLLLSTGSIRTTLIAIDSDSRSGVRRYVEVTRPDRLRALHPREYGPHRAVSDDAVS